MDGLAVIKIDAGATAIAELVTPIPCEWVTGCWRSGAPSASIPP